MQIGENGHELPGQVRLLAVDRRILAELNFDIEDQQAHQEQQEEGHVGERVGHALIGPRQVDIERHHRQRCRRDHQVDEPLHADRSQDAPDRDFFGIGQQVASQHFPRAQRKHEVCKQAREHGPDRPAKPHFPEGCQQEFPSQRLNHIAQDVAAHPDEHPFPANIREVFQLLDDVEIVQHPHEADRCQPVADEQKQLRPLLEGILGCGVQRGASMRVGVTP